MKFRSLHKWKLDESLFGLLFFAQRMDEMLFDYSLDTYKPAALNPPFLCVEALKLVGDIEDGVIEVANLNHILDELQWAIRNDKISKSLLDLDLEQYFLDREKSSLYLQKLRLEVLHKTLEPYRYLDRCKELLRNAVIEIHKRNIDFYSRSLVTTLVNIGVSKSHLYSKVQEFFFINDEPTIASPKQIDEFLEFITPYQHDFEIYFIASNLVKEVSDSVKAFCIEIIDELPDELKEKAEKAGFSLKEDEVYVEVKNIKTFDCNSAREEADRQLDTLKDLFTLFYHKNQITWRDETLISQCCIDNPAIIRQPKNVMEKAFDMRPQRASKQLNWLINNLALKFGGSFKKFNRTVDLHGICIENPIPENQLLNLWISLETLVPSRVGKNKINNVISSVRSFIRLTYVRRLIERFVSDLMVWNKYATKRILKKVPDSKGLSLHLKALYLLAIKNNQNLRDELYGDLRDFHLLRFRAFTLADVLGEPKKLQVLLDTHDRKVSWQIRRMYRTRNLIVHSERTPNYISTLIENGHDYLDLILNEVMELSCGDYRIKTLAQAFELEKIFNQKFEQKLAKIESFTEDNVGFLFEPK